MFYQNQIKVFEISHWGGEISFTSPTHLHSPTFLVHFKILSIRTKCIIILHFRKIISSDREVSGQKPVWARHTPLYDVPTPASRTKEKPRNQLVSS
jgi:hypothetical protein